MIAMTIQMMTSSWLNTSVVMNQRMKRGKDPYQFAEFLFHETAAI